MRKNSKIGFQGLRVYHLSEKLSDEVWMIVKRWNLLARDTVGRQLIRAADSIGANIAEGTGRGSFQDSRRFVKNARGSLYETRHWLRRAHKRRLLSSEPIRVIKPILDELGPKLNAYLRSIGPVAEPDPTRRTTSEPLRKGQVTKDEGPMGTDTHSEGVGHE